MRIGNNSKLVRGMKRAIEHIERYCLAEYEGREQAHSVGFSIFYGDPYYANVGDSNTIGKADIDDCPWCMSLNYFFQ